MYVEKRLNRRRRRVILPRRGLTSRALTDTAFRATGGFISVAALQELAWESLNGADRAPAPADADWFTAMGREAIFANGDDLIEVLGSHHADGPKLVRMKPATERAFRAVAPQFRLAPLTRYRLTAGAAHPLGEGGAGTFLDDFRRRLYGQLGAGPQGDGVLVAVLDTGVDRTHPRLAAAYAGGRGMVAGETHDPWGEIAGGPRSGHGTHVAGLIAARGDPTTGPVGVAPGARFRSYRIYARSKVLKGADNPSILGAIQAAVDDHCHIVNLSFGGGKAYEDGVRDAINYAWDRGVVCVGAAGNDGKKRVDYPAAHPNCVAVSAIGRRGCYPEDGDWADEVADPFSTIDPDVFVWKSSNYGSGIDFAAPGHALCSTLPGGAIGLMSGTSSAAPVLAGVAAVLLSRAPGILNAPADAGRSEAIVQLLASRARVLSFGSPDYEGLGLVRP